MHQNILKLIKSVKSDVKTAVFGKVFKKCVSIAKSVTASTSPGRNGGVHNREENISKKTNSIICPSSSRFHLQFSA